MISRASSGDVWSVLKDRVMYVAECMIDRAKTSVAKCLSTDCKPNFTKPNLNPGHWLPQILILTGIALATICSLPMKTSLANPTKALRSE